VVEVEVSGGGIGLNFTGDWHNTHHPKRPGLTADHADNADKRSIRAISEIRDQPAWRFS